MGRTRACTLAVGAEYRAMALRLAADLRRFGGGLSLLVGTDAPGEFHRVRGVRAFRVTPGEGRWSRLNGKRLVLGRALETADAALFIDADSRVVARFPGAGPWEPGLTAPHESLERHLRRWWPGRGGQFEAAARAEGVSFAQALWIGEPLYVLAKDRGRERRFLSCWERLAERLDRAGFNGGEGNVMGLAALKARLAVRWGDWSALQAAVIHLNVSARRGDSLTGAPPAVILRHGPSTEASAQDEDQDAREGRRQDPKGGCPTPEARAARPGVIHDRARPAHRARAAHGAGAPDGAGAADGAGASDRAGPAHRAGAPDRRSLSRRRPLVSVVVIAKNEGGHLRRTVEILDRTRSRDVEILVVDDGSTDGGARFLERRGAPARLVRSPDLGVTKARNHGARLARGEVVIFSDAHVDAPEGWEAPLLAALSEPGVGAVAPGVSVMGRPERVGYGLRIKGDDLSTHWLKRAARAPYPAPILPGCFLAMTRRVFEATGGFDEGMDRFGMSDVELGVRFWLSGLEMRVVPAVEVAHLFRAEHPYEVRWRSFLHNRARLAFVHFDERRIAAVLDCMRDRPEFPAAMAMLARGDAGERRRALEARRAHDADWYFERFAAGLEPVSRS